MSVDVKKYKFGIIGYGFLGSAITHGFGLHADIKIYDKFKNFDSLEDVVNHSDVIWICLPTPMNLETGEIDFGIIDENLQAIHNLIDESVKPTDTDKKVVIIKSTVIPGTTREFSKKYPKLEFVMNPEFLTARNNKLDFICASRIILGTHYGITSPNVQIVKELYEYRFGNSVPIYYCGWEEAEITKYAANCFFAIKISYFNTLYSMCEKINEKVKKAGPSEAGACSLVEFDKVRDMVLADGRIGRSHANVPGWDSQRGYGGSCFPKDINAFIKYTESLGVDKGLLEASWAQNLKDRPSRDWEDIPSAVSKKENG